MPNMCPFEKKEKEVFFRLPTFFFRNKKIFSKEQLLFSFLCIVKQKKFRSDPKFFFFENLLNVFLKMKIFYVPEFVGFQTMLIIDQKNML